MLSYIITFLKRIRIFMHWNEVVMDCIFITLCVFTMCRHVKFAHYHMKPLYLATLFIYIRRYEILEELIYGHVCEICVAFFVVCKDWNFDPCNFKTEFVAYL